MALDAPSRQERAPSEHVETSCSFGFNVRKAACSQSRKRAAYSLAAVVLHAPSRRHETDTTIHAQNGRGDQKREWYLAQSHGVVNSKVVRKRRASSIRTHDWVVRWAFCPATCSTDHSARCGKIRQWKVSVRTVPSAAGPTPVVGQRNGTCTGDLKSGGDRPGLNPARRLPTGVVVCCGAEIAVAANEHIGLA
jgi:hypothetical protein